MREIRYRAWDLEDEKMYDVEGITFLNVAHLPSVLRVKLWNDEEFIDREARMIRLMQCTGTKDTNDIEIYEGDLFKRGPHVIHIKSLDWFFWMKYDDQMRIDFSQGEIIGNIYENPEMI